MPPPPDAADTPFWHFSLDFYGQDGVAAACLDLQDRAGLDVNLLLFALWLGVEGRAAADSSAWQDWQDAIAPWMAVGIQPLRTLRRCLRAPVPGVADAEREYVRSLVSGAELAAERLAQRVLFDLAPPAAAAKPAAEAAVANLSAYLSAAGRRPDVADREALGTLLDAAVGPVWDTRRLLPPG